MNKFFKYYSNFNALLIVAAFLMLPFVPFAKFSGKEAPLVLATKSSKFSEVYAFKVFESSLPAQISSKTYKDVLAISNNTSEKKSYKVVILEKSENVLVKPYFFSNNLDVVSLLPNESAGVFLDVEKVNEALPFKVTLEVLESL